MAEAGGEGGDGQRREPALPSAQYSEEELRAAARAKKVERQGLHRNPLVHIPPASATKPSVAQQQAGGAASTAGGNLPNPPPPVNPLPAEHKKKRQRDRKGKAPRLGRRGGGIGVADAVATAVPHIAGVGASALPSQVSYPHESTRVEPWTQDQQNELSRMALLARRERDASLMSEHRSPVLEGLPINMAPFGYGKDREVINMKEFQVTSRADYDGMDQESEDRQEVESEEYRFRLRQVSTEVGTDEAIADEDYLEDDFEQLPKCARVLFNRALVARRRFQNMVKARHQEWVGFSEAQMHELTESTGNSGPWPEVPGDYFLRAIVTAVTTRHVQIAVYGSEGIAAVAYGIGLTDTEKAGLVDLLAMTDVVRDTLLDSIETHFKEYLLLHATTWQQSMLIGSVVTARVRPVDPPPDSDPNIGRVWHIISLEPTICGIGDDETAPSTSASRMETLAEPEVLISEPDLGFAGFGVATRNRSEEQLKSPHPSGVCDLIIHLGVEKAGPIGVYRTALVDPLAEEEEGAVIDFRNPKVLDISQVTDGTIVACIGVYPQREMELRGMQRPYPLPQILQFCPVPAAELENLLHVQPQHYTKLNVFKQFQFLKYYHSLQLALSNYHEHMERATAAKACVVAPVIEWAITEAEPRICVSLPVIAPRTDTLSRVQARRLAQNEDFRLRPDDMVRVLMPAAMHTQARSPACQQSLLSGADVAWSHSFIGRCVTAVHAVNEKTKNSSLTLEIELTAFDRSRLVQVANEARKAVILEPVSHSSIAESHFRATGSAWYLARLCWGRHDYADLSRKPEPEFSPRNVDWIPPPRTDFEGLVGEVAVPPGRTVGQGAANRSLLGLQMDQNALAPMDPQMGMQEFAAPFYQNTACSSFLKMELEADDGVSAPVEIRPSEEEVAIGVRLHGCRPSAVTVVGGAGSGKTTCALMLVHDYLLRGRALFKWGTPARMDIRRTLVVCASASHSDAFVAKAARAAARQRQQPYRDESDVEHAPDKEFYGATDRENPIRICQIRGGRALTHMDDVSDAAPDMVRRLRPESCLALEELPTPGPHTKVPVAKPSFNTLEQTYYEYRRQRAFEYGQPVPMPQYMPSEGEERWLFKDYETAHKLWRDYLERLQEKAEQQPSSGQKVMALEYERALYFLLVHYLCYMNPNLIVVMADDLRSPLLRCLSQCGLIVVDDARMLSVPQIAYLMEYTVQYNWCNPRSQFVLFGNDNGPLPMTLAKGDAFAARRLSTFTCIVRAMFAQCLPNQPHSRLAYVHALTKQFRLPREIATWATKLALGAALPEAHTDVWRPPEMPDFIHQIGVSATWFQARRSLELVDMQSATVDVRHPLHGYVNTVQHVFLMVMFEVARWCKSYLASRAMIVTVTREAAFFLREFVRNTGIEHFPPVYSPTEALGHTADLVVLAATTVPNAALLAQAASDSEALRRLTAHFGAFADARLLLDLVQRANHKVIILANLNMMDALQNETWQNLKAFCTSYDSMSTASYSTMRCRTKMDVNSMAVTKHNELVAYLKYSDPVDLQALKRDLDTGGRLEPLAPIHLLHTLNTADPWASGLTPEGRYFSHLRQAESRCLEWRSRFVADKIVLPKEATRTDLTEAEVKDGVFVGLGSSTIYFAASAPESHVNVRVAQPVVTPVVPSVAAADVVQAVEAAVEQPIEEDMPDDGTRANREAFERQMRRYGRRGGQMQQLSSAESAAPVTPLGSGSVGSSTPSSANTNVSSAGSSSYIEREGPRGCYLSGTASAAALQVSQRTMRKETRATDGSQGRPPSASAPVSKRQRTQDVAASAPIQVLFPGAMTQEELMPPPMQPVVGVAARGRSTSRPSHGDPPPGPRPQSRSPPRRGGGKRGGNGGGGQQRFQSPMGGFVPLQQQGGGVPMGRGGAFALEQRGGRPPRSFFRGGGGGGGEKRRPLPRPIPDQPTTYLPRRQPPARPCAHCGSLQHFSKQCTGPWTYAWARKHEGDGGGGTEGTQQYQQYQQYPTQQYQQYGGGFGGAQHE